MVQLAQVHPLRFADAAQPSLCRLAHARRRRQVRGGGGGLAGAQVGQAQVEQRPDHDGTTCTASHRAD